jgi:Sec-independent protein secretion pathway component TatC
MMTLPVWGLYEIGILLVRMQQRRRIQQQAESA